MERPNWAPGELDLTVPSAARVYDYYLGGSHNFAVDRAQARQAIEQWPLLPAALRANRAFLRRAVKFCLTQGIRQFLDIGSGIPTVGNVHEIAQAFDPACRIAYVDVDPIAVAHSRLMLSDNPNTAVVQADLRTPGDVLDAPELTKLLDLSQPTAVLFVAVLHFIADEEDPAGLVRRYLDAVPSGSYLVLSHGSSEGAPQRAAQHEDLYQRTGSRIFMRSRQRVLTYFGDCELLPPGLSQMTQWRPEPDDEYWGSPEQLSGFTGVGYKA
ncbi:MULTISPECIES: SAM-dependent methyltransferase [unclassified Crossiella]|uniref:SAM-dependent methyltransferase n=1 Tax=unclassified Crossiella TaxID=2620835 RepID=UPI001FFE8866|nr:MULTISPECIES: SAM-dependent methyltransferase [unclassified Crossiella]MCK2236500.1 SAM-dependent methyltransferase [Crossiella sp. S99.2]MCK2250167.1 SAM-dependent methyltransferase [Crossiella sp. S99.1]